MRTIILAAAASLVAATPALANEARIEARGGVYWTDGYTKGTAGLAAGYDYDLGSQAFVGAEVSGDKILASGTKVAFGFTGRGGAKLGGGKLYVDGGYTTKPCDLCDGSWHAGAGYERTIVGQTYGKLAYRHYFTKNGAPDANAVVVGVGYKF
ncbi:hypothetical protein OLX02_16690 [Novosphingobium sp. KCTC 2891]|uniref:hypothetical protein n=1 Tax=Novosphingobium sp. KCTC 2891 TaxID=2989730 RepID=UPI00222356C3|nr:hypothetical protein [Novosphingobium sp. KCTC 2891]MCW1384461.1 hypothetical protein [Novosphingobium sp. KCTC 2891]